MHKRMVGNHHLDHQHHAHQYNTIDHFHNRHRLTTSIVPSCIYDFERQKKITINAHSSVLAGTSHPPLIHPSTRTSNTSPINTEPPKDLSPQFKQREHHSNQMTENKEHRSKTNPQTNKMAPKQARASAKSKELQTAETPLVRRLKNIKNANVE